MSDEIDPELESGYNVRAARDDYEALINDWMARSEALRSGVRGFPDLAYGPAPRQRLDIFPAAGDGPTLVYLHGGYWQRGDKSVYSFLAAPFNEHNVNVVVMGYTLCPDITVPGIVEEIRGGLAWLYRNAEQYGLGPERLNVCGHSAGGHLTAMMLATNWRAQGDDLPLDLVKSGIPISGLYDLEPLRHTSINQAARIDADAARGASPLFLEPATRAPVLAVAGGAETSMFHDQMARFAAEWSAHGVRVEQHVEPGVDHFDVVNRLADVSSALFKKSVDWLV